MEQWEGYEAEPADIFTVPSQTKNRDEVTA
jgi:hypothetical protein